MNNVQFDSLNCGRMADSGIDLKGSTQLLYTNENILIMIQFLPIEPPNPTHWSFKWNQRKDNKEV